MHEIISTLERKNNDDGSDMVDLLDYAGYPETALLETFLLRYLVGNSKPLFGSFQKWSCFTSVHT